MNGADEEFVLDRVNGYRQWIANARANAETAGREVARLDLAVAQARQRLSEAAPGSQEAAEAAAELDRSTGELRSAERARDEAAAQVQTARRTYDTEVAGTPALWPRRPATPLLLLPLRLETAFHGGTDARELWIRVYPDEIHVDAHEPALTAGERAAARAYWERRWADGLDPDGEEPAWRELVDALGPDRAAWSAEALRPSGAPPDPLVFPDVPERAAAWTRAAHTAMLPDTLVFSGYVGGELGFRQEGRRIPATLPVGPAPSPPGAPRRDRPWDDGCRWLTDFDAAVEAGMAVRVPLLRPDLRFDLITVVGVRSGRADDDAARFQELLRAHHYTGGLAVLPAGTPTTNTPGTRSGWRSRTDPFSPAETAAARDRYEPASAQAAARAAHALGLDGREVLSTVPDAADEAEAEILGLVHRLLGWAAAGSPQWRPRGGNDPTEHPDLRYLVDHFALHVRGRGMPPTLRVGRQPYGLLPATSLDLWRGEEVDGRIVERLGALLAWLTNEVRDGRARPARIGNGPDQDAVILDLLSRRPAAARILTADLDRPTGGPGPFNGAVPPGSGFAHAWGRADDLVAEVPAADDPPPELLELQARRPVAEYARLVADLRTLLDAWPADQPQPDISPLAPRMEALEAALLPLTKAQRIGIFYRIAIPIVRVQFGFTLFAKMAERNPDATPQERRTCQQLMINIRHAVDVLIELEEHATADLGRIDRLCCEALDALSHRIDAWITSLAGVRLAELRRGEPTGLHLGAYGWLVDLPRANETGGREPGDGYIVAPSPHHATTAAVLRSGWLAHSDKSAFAIDLTSERVRRALALVDGIGGGRSLGELLGYQVERELHDRGLDSQIERLRATFPLPRPVDRAAGDDDTRGARDVLDGEAFRKADLRRLGFSDNIVGLQRQIADTVDAVGDLLLAESVHHLVGGDPLRAGLAADGIGRGEGLPQEFEVIRTPRSGTGVTHRVGVLVPAGPAGPDAGGWRRDRAAAVLEPAADRWCRARLGPAAGWRFGFATPAGEVEVGLADLATGGLEVVLGARPGTAAPLARRLARAAAAASRPPAEFTEAGAARYAELALLCESLRDVLAAATPLLPAHLDPAAGGWAATDLDELSHRAGRWQHAVAEAAAVLGARLTDCRAAAPADLPAAATKAAEALDELADLGLPDAITPGPPGADPSAIDALVSQAAALHTRLTAVPEIAAPPTPAAGQATVTDTAALTWATAVTDRIVAMLGADIPLLPVLRPDAVGGALSSAPAGAEEDAVADWLLAAGQVRPRVRDLGDAYLAAETITGGRPAGYGTTVVQVPVEPAAPWAAVAHPGPTPRTCAVLHTDGTPDGAAVAGLVVDAWTETVPARPPEAPQWAGQPVETGAIAFHYNRPDSRAPQALILAVPPDVRRGWRIHDVHAIVEDTLQLAELRGLDVRDVPDLRPLLPLMGE